MIDDAICGPDNATAKCSIASCRDELCTEHSTLCEIDKYNFSRSTKRPGFRMAVTGNVVAGSLSLLNTNAFITAGSPGNDYLQIATPSSGLSGLTLKNLTGFLGINNTSPQYNLDVGGTGRYTGKLQISGGTSDIPAINPDAYNTLMVYEDCMATILNSGTLTNTAINPTSSNNYIQLTANGSNVIGQVYWNINPGNGWVLSAETFFGGGSVSAYTSGGNGICFYAYSQTAPPTIAIGNTDPLYYGLTNAYCIGFTEFTGGPGLSAAGKSLILSYNGTLLASALPSLSYNTWSQVKIVFMRNLFRIYLNSILVLQYQDINRSLGGGSCVGITSSTGSATNSHYVKNVKISKYTGDEFWTQGSLTGTSISYSGGNVGIGTPAPAYALDVTGIAQFRGDGGQFSKAVRVAETTFTNDTRAAIQIGNAWEFGQDKAATGVRDFYVFNNTNSTYPFYASVTSVGIFNTSPSYSLDVSGTGRFTGALAANSGLTATGNITVSSYSGFGTAVPTGRVHIVGSGPGGGTGDCTNVPNPTLIISESVSYPRVLHTSSDSVVCAVYDYQTTKNVYWGEVGDTGSYCFRGRNLSTFGSAGIGSPTLSPSYTLDVFGTSRAQQSIIGTGSLTSLNVVPPNGLVLVSTVSATATAPHVHIYSNSAYPTLQQLNWSTDNTALSFDSYWDLNPTGSWRLSGTTTPFRLFKFNSTFRLDWAQTGTATQPINWSTALLVNSGGQVGINNANPAFPLDVGSAARFSGSITSTLGATSVWAGGAVSSNYTAMAAQCDAAGQMIMFMNGSARTIDGGTLCGTIRNDAGGDMRFITSSGTGMFVQKSTGNVGIGNSMTTPAYQLDVGGSLHSSGTMLCDVNLRVGSGSNLPNALGQALLSNGTNSISMVPGYANTAGGTVAVIEAFNMGNSSKIALALNCFGGGNVGIGTYGPQYTLDVVGSGRVLNNLYTGTLMTGSIFATMASLSTLTATSITGTFSSFSTAFATTLTTSNFSPATLTTGSLAGTFSSFMTAFASTFTTNNFSPATLSTGSIAGTYSSFTSLVAATGIIGSLSVIPGTASGIQSTIYSYQPGGSGRIFVDGDYIYSPGLSLRSANAETSVLYRPGGGSDTRMWMTAVGDVMTWTQTARVGIGITSPAFTLDVNGPARIIGTLTIGSIAAATASCFNQAAITGSSYYGMDLQQCGASIGISSNTFALGFCVGSGQGIYNSGTTQMSLNSQGVLQVPAQILAGTVGINTSTAMYPLDVNGSVRFGVSGQGQRVLTSCGSYLSNPAYTQIALLDTINSNNNGGFIHIRGGLTTWIIPAYVDVTISSRVSLNVTSKVDGNISPSSNLPNVANLLVYQTSANQYAIYLYVGGYAWFDLEIQYGGPGILSQLQAPTTTTPTGTVVFNLQSQQNINVSSSGVAVGGTLAAFPMHVSPTSTDNPAINPEAFKSLMICEDYLQSTLNSGSLSGAAAYVYGTTSPNYSYVQLTTTNNTMCGNVTWNFNPGEAWVMTAETYAGGGNGADWITFFAYSNQLPNASGPPQSGYAFMWDEYASINSGTSPATIYYNGSSIASLANGAFNVPQNTWNTVKVVFFRNSMRMYMNNTLLLNYRDIPRALGTTPSICGFSGRTGGSNNNHYVRNMRVSKYVDTVWNYSSITSSDIVFYGGNVGIGTQTPSYQLDVTGSTRLGNFFMSSYNGAMWLIHQSQASNNTQNFALYQSALCDTVLNTGAGQALEFKVGNLEYARMNSSGQWGFGTIYPQYTVDVNGTGRMGNGLMVGSSTTLQNQMLCLWSNDPGNTLLSSSINYYGFGINQYTLRYNVPSGASHTFYASNTMLMSVNQTGLGVFNSNPAYPLDVSGSIHSNGTILSDIALNVGPGYLTNPCLGQGQFSNGTNTISLEPGYSNQAGGTVSIIECYNNGNSAKRALALNPFSGGNVGIGTISPQYTLDVNGSVQFGYNDNASLGHYTLGFVKKPGYQNNIVCSSDANIIFGKTSVNQSSGGIFSNPANATFTEMMRLTNAGFLGLNNQNPAYPLDIISGYNLARFQWGGYAGTVTNVSIESWFPGIGFNQINGVFNNTGATVPVFGGIIWQNTPANGYIQIAPTTNTGTATQAATYATGIYITPQNQLGVNQSSPQYNLDVNGNARVSSTLWFNNQVQSQMLCLFTNDGSLSSSSTNFYGLGMGPYTLRYQVPNGLQHQWFSGTTTCMTLNSTGLGLFQSPSYSLDVSGTGRFTNTLYANNGILIPAGGTALNFSDTNKGLMYSGANSPGNYFASSKPSDGLMVYGWVDGGLGTKYGGNNQIALYWNSSQQVGINQVNPSYTLDVNGTVQFGFNDNASMGHIQLGFFKKYGYQNAIACASDMNILFGKTSVSSGNGGVLTSPGNATWTEMMRLTNSGNLGINNQNPAYPLDVYCGNNGNAARFSFSNGCNVSLEGWYPGIGFNQINNTFNNVGGGAVYGAMIWLCSPSNGYIQIAPTTTTGTATQAVTLATGIWITPQNQLGVNTSSPQYTLDVNGIANIRGDGSQFNRALRIAETTYSGSVRAAIQYGNGWEIGQDSKGTGVRDMYFYNDTTNNGNYPIYLSTNNLVGISIGTSPLYNLDVGGSFRSQQAIVGTGSLSSLNVVPPNGLILASTISSNAAGPHVHAYPLTTYPTFQQLNWAPDNTSMNFDSYFDFNGSWRSSSSVSPFQIYKTAGQLQFNWGTTGTASAVTGWNTGIVLSNTGSVGVSNNSPQYNLDVTGVTRNITYNPSALGPRLILHNTGGGPGSGGAIDFYTFTGNNNYSPGVRIYGFDDGSFGGHLALMTRASVSGSLSGTVLERMRITDSGNVGIGTTTPSYLLDVNGSGRFMAPVYIPTTNASGQLVVGSSSAISSANGPLHSYGTPNTRTAISTYQNDNGSQTHLEFFNPQGRAGYIASYNAQVSIVSNSDRRMKTMIQTMDATTALLVINKVRPVTFAYKNQPESRINGFIADELQEMVPEAVFGEKDEIDDEGKPKYQAVDVCKLIPYLTTALQESLKNIANLQAIVMEQKAALDTQRDQIAGLFTRLESFEQMK